MDNHKQHLTSMIIFFACLVFGLEAIALIKGEDGTTFGLAMTALGTFIGYWLRYAYQKRKESKNKKINSTNTD